MNIQVVLLSVVLAAFVGLWSNDQGVEVSAVPRPPEIYDPNRSLSVRPTDAPLKLATSLVTQVDVPNLPAGISAGTYQVVNHFGDVRTLTISVSDLGQKAATAPQDLYVQNEAAGCWYFIRLTDQPANHARTVLTPDGPTLK